MREFDFLPEWYKNDKRRHVHVRRQYAALAVVFLAMMIFNGTAIHRAGKAAAEAMRLENHRVGAEAVVHEFNVLTKQLNERKTRASLVEQMDSKVDIAAILAEMSQVIGDSIVLRKVEIQAEPFSRAEDKAARTSVVRLADRPGSSEKEKPLGRMKFRIVLTGVAAQPADVADLVCRLDGSAYFQRVHPLFYGNAKGQAGSRSVPSLPDSGTAAKAPGVANVTEFEIACYLANYKDIED